MSMFVPDIVTGWGTLLLWAVVAYLVGSVSAGVLVARAMNLGDLRKIGSGNIGATNVLRTGNKAAAALTLLGDALKGVVMVLAARATSGEDAAQVAALAVFVGHCFPVWLRFRGGKGVATFLGVVLALAWPVGIAACLVWLVTAAVSRYSSLAALVAAGWTPVLAMIIGPTTIALLCVILALLVYWRHGANIARLRAGTESKIGRA